jgi:predicted transcriptional regulator of viral defense system
MVAELPTRVTELAEFQDGVLTRAQALGYGLTDAVIRARVSGGYWRPAGRGVYLTFTGPPQRRCLLWAAVLQAGHGAVLSHQSAAELHRLSTMPTEPIHVTVPIQRRVDRIPGVSLHYSRRLDEARHPCLQPPCTRIEETVLDLAQSAGTFDEAVAWLCRAVGGRFTTTQHLSAAMHARARLRRRAGLTAALSDVGDGAHSLLELLYVKIERRHGLPRAARQARVILRGRTVYRDNLYGAYLVAVELDGRAAHPAETRWRDMRRDNAGAVEGIVTLRYGYADETERPCEVAAEVAAVLRSRGWPGHPRRCGPDCTIRKDPRRSSNQNPSR